MIPDERLSLQVDDILAKFFAQQDSGEAPDPIDYLREYPHCANELEMFFREEGVLTKHLVVPTSKSSLFCFGEYEVGSELGRGGLGIVYQATHMKTGDSVALKILSAPAARDTKHLLRFHNETTTLQQLHHPHIVRILDSGCEETSPFYAMQLINGTDLRQWIKDNADDHLADYAKRVCRMLQPIAEALAHSHKAGILHRDIKPSNILIDADGKAYLADFGLARLPGAVTLTMTGDVVGTLRYASPEQIAGERTAVDERTDIYSFGATLWEALARRPLVEEDDRRLIIHNVLNTDPFTTSSVGADVPYDADTILLRCLAKEPKERYQSAHDLSDDLKRFASGVRVKASRPTWSEIASRWARRNQKLMAASVLGLVLLTILSLASLGFILRAQKNLTLALNESERHQETSEANEERALRLLYASDMQQANDAWIAGNYAEMHAKLDAIEEYDSKKKIRRVEWNVLKEQGNRDTQLLYEGEGPIYAIACSPDGKTFASGDGESLLRLHDLKTGQLLREFPTNQKEINYVSFSPDGTRLATAGDNGTVCIWDATSFELVRELAVGEGQVAWTCEFSRDGQRIATTGKGSFLIFSLGDGKLLDQQQSSETPRGVKDIGETANGEIITAAGPGLRKWISKDGKLEIKSAVDVTTEEGGYIQDFCIFDNHDVMVTTHRDGANVVVRGLDKLWSRGTDTYGSAFRQLVAFPKHDLVAGCTKEGVVHLLGLKFLEGNVIGTRPISGWIEPEEPSSMIATPDQSNLIYSVGNQIRQMEISDLLDTDVEPKSHYQNGYIVSTPYSTNYVTVTSDEIRYGDRSEDKIQSKTIHVAVSADNDQVAAITPEGRVRVWQTKTRKLSHDLKLPNPHSNSLHFGPKGQFIALQRFQDVEDRNLVPTTDGMCVFDLAENTIRSTDDTRLCSLATFDHNGRIIFIRQRDVACRDAKTLELCWAMHRGIHQPKFCAMHIHPELNRVALFTLDGQLDIVNTEDGTVLESHRIGLPVVSVAWDLVEERMYLRGLKVNGLSILDSSTFRLVATLPSRYVVDGSQLSLISQNRLAFCRIDGCQSIRLPRFRNSAAN